jgi:hypothetical protein
LLSADEIIRDRIDKLNSIGFAWDGPMEKYIPSTIPINLLEMDYISQPTENRD